MGRVDVRLPDAIEKAFREEVFKRKGMKRGNITEAIQEAVLLWIDKKEKETT